MFVLLSGSMLLAVSAPAAIAAGRGDRVSGWGVREPSCAPGCPVGEFAFDVRSGRNGENPTGWFSIDFPGYASLVGQPTCVEFTRKKATIVGVITRGTGAADPSTFPPSGTDPVYFVVRVKGRGAPLPGRPGPDWMSVTAWDTEAGWNNDSNITLAELCAEAERSEGVGPDWLRLIAGDIRVINR
jgi:hypothetical protein